MVLGTLRQLEARLAPLPPDESVDPKRARRQLEEVGGALVIGIKWENMSP